MLVTRVTPVGEMKDETFIRHLELRHGNDLTMRFLPEPDQEAPRLHAPVEWRTYHQHVHNTNPSAYDHEHNERDDA